MRLAPFYYTIMLNNYLHKFLSLSQLSLSGNRWAATYYFLNIVACGVFIIAQSLGHVHFPYPLYVIGLVIYFFPGHNLALALEQLSGVKHTFSRLITWGFIYSLIITPSVIYLIGLLINRNPITHVFFLFMLWWLITLAILFVFQYIKRTSTGLTTIALPLSPRSLMVCIGIFLFILIVHFCLYRYIPEADGYGYLLTLERLKELPHQLVNEPRSVFVILTHCMTTLSTIPAYWLYKGIFPLFSFASLLVMVAMTRSIPSGWLRWLLIFSPLFAPVVIEEILIIRPQSLFLFTLLPIGYLLAKTSLERKSGGNIFWLLSLLTVSALGTRAHNIFMLLVPIVLIGIIIFYWPKIRKYPADAMVVGLMIMLAVYPWLSNFSFLSGMASLFHLLVDALQAGKVDLWFLDNYTNVDGNPVGWPGWSAFYYYGYNLGFFLPVSIVVIGASFFSKQRKPKLSLGWPLFWPIVICLLFFLLVAEILPRFGLAFLPDRAWLFVSLLLTVLLVAIFRTLNVARLPKFAPYVLTAAAVFSILVGWATTYMKQGWVTPADYQSVAFIKENIPHHARFLGQGSNQILVRYFADRNFNSLPVAILLSDDPQDLQRFLENETNQIKSNIIKAQEKLIDNKRVVDELMTQFFATDNPEVRQQIIGSITSLLTEYQSLSGIESSNLSEELEQIEAQPIYLIYSYNKFSGLYGKRAWWQKSNAMGANLKKFDDHYPLVYNQNGVLIWEVRK